MSCLKHVFNLVRRTEERKMSQQIWQKEQGRQFCAGFSQFLVDAKNRKDKQDKLFTVADLFTRSRPLVSKQIQFRTQNPWGTNMRYSAAGFIVLACMGR